MNRTWKRAIICAVIAVASVAVTLLLGQIRFIQLLEALGLAWDVRTPETLPARGALRPLQPCDRSTGRAPVR